MAQRASPVATTSRATVPGFTNFETV